MCLDGLVTSCIIGSGVSFGDNVGFGFSFCKGAYVGLGFSIRKGDLYLFKGLLSLDILFTIGLSFPLGTFRMFI